MRTGTITDAMRIAPILCLTGKPAAGTAALLDCLVPALVAGGLNVGVVRPADMQPGGPPTPGPGPVILTGPDGLSIRSAQGHAQLLDLTAMFCGECDLVLAEGFEQSPYDKIHLLGDGPDSPLESVRLVVSSRSDSGRGVVGRDDVGALAEWIAAWLKRRRRLGGNVMGAVLVGGRSRRMGTDKATMKFGGRAVLPRLAELLGGRVSEVWTIGRRVEVEGMPACVGWHLDIRAEAGPLAGIATALRIAQAVGRCAVLAVACDMPALSADVLDFLLERRRPETCATVLRNRATGHLEPLAAVYEPQFLEKIEQALDAGRLSVVKLLESAGANEVEVPPELAHALVNVNTPEELDTLQRDN